MTEEREGFAARWSRLKRQGDRAGERPSQPEPAAETVPPPAAQTAAEPVAAEELPDPETLSPDADFSVFMRENVPELLRRRALRRLWRSNPIIASVDMLDDYCEDFTDAATAATALKTAFRTGRKMLEEAAEGDGRAGGARREAAAPAVAPEEPAATTGEEEPPQPGSGGRDMAAPARSPGEGAESS